MPTSERLAGFALTALVVSLSPGPSVLYVVTRGASVGRRAALATVAGDTLAMLGQATVVAFGLGALIQRSATILTSIRLIGVCYLIFLGLQAILRKQPPRQVTAGHEPTRRYATQGFFVGITNPKAALFLVATLPQFVNASDGSTTAQLLILGSVFALLCLITASVYAVLSGVLGDWLSHRDTGARAISVASGVTMIGIAIRLALTGRQD